MLDPDSLPSRRPLGTILAVDDSRTNLGVIGRRLTHLGYLAALSDSGSEALDLIAARGFDLIPSPTDGHPCAHDRSPMDMMRHGCSTRRFHAKQQ